MHRAGLKKLRAVMREKDAGVFWLPNHEKSGQPGTRHLSGFTGSDSHLVVTRNKAYFLTDGRYLAAAKKEVKGCQILDVAKERPSRFIDKILPRKGKRVVLIDGSVTRFSLVEKIKEKVPRLTIVNADGLLMGLRRVKIPQEIALLTKAGDISCRAFEKFLPFVRVGVTERELARKLSDLLLDCGADGVAFDPIIASGKNAAFPHARPTEKKLRRGELVIIDFGATYRGYCADMTRTVALGKVSPRLLKMYEAVREAQGAGCGTARAGIPARAVDTACRDTLAKHGFEKYFTHATGHGVGMEIHELPFIGAKSDGVLQAGEVITCEPGVYIPGVGGVRIEDTLAMTRKGTLNLTSRVEKKLVVR